MAAKVHVKIDAPPIFMKARSVPYYCKEMVWEALEKLVKEDMLEPISYSEWATPVVPVLKTDKKSVRIFGDFKELERHVHCDKVSLTEDWTTVVRAW